MFVEKIIYQTLLSVLLTGLVIGSEWVCGLFNSAFSTVPFAPKTVLSVFFIFFVTLGVPFRRVKILFIGLLFYIQFSQIMYYSYFGRFYGPVDVEILFFEIEDVLLGVVGAIDVLLPPILVGLVSIISAAILFSRLNEKIVYGKRARSIYTVAFILLVMLPGIPALKGKPFESNSHYISLRNGLGVFHYFLVNELPEILSGNSASGSYVQYKIVPNRNLKKYHIVLVMGESLTYEHMSIYGYERETTPNMVRLSQSGWLFHRPALARGTSTRTSIPIFFNLMYEPDNKLKLTSMDTSLFALAKSVGYRTHYLSTQKSGVLGSTFPRNKIDSWADVYALSDFESNGDERLFEAIDRFGVDFSQREFLVLHQRNNHFPYEDNYSSEFSRYHTKQASHKQNLIDTYDNGVLYQDDWMRRLFDKLAALTDAPLLVIYTADHGEMFGENGLFGHTHLDVEAGKVPFLLYGLNISDAKEFESIVNIFDECPLNHYTIGKGVASLFGVSVINNNEEKGVYYLNQTLPKGENTKYLVYSEPDLAEQFGCANY